MVHELLITNGIHGQMKIRDSGADMSSRDLWGDHLSQRKDKHSFHFASDVRTGKSLSSAIDQERGIFQTDSALCMLQQQGHHKVDLDVNCHRDDISIDGQVIQIVSAVAFLFSGQKSNPQLEAIDVLEVEMLAIGILQELSSTAHKQEEQSQKPEEKRSAK